MIKNLVIYDRCKTKAEDNGLIVVLCEEKEIGMNTYSECLTLCRNPENSFEGVSKGNTVAVFTNIDALEAFLDGVMYGRSNSQLIAR